MAKRFAFACFVCKGLTECIDIESERFFCDTRCFAAYKQDDTRCDQTEVIHSTRDIRQTRNKKCNIKDDQKCHVFGLNACKKILNTYARQCARIEPDALATLTKVINDVDNLVCCSVKKNILDKTVEKRFLDIFLHHTRSYDAPDEAVEIMYNAMKRVFTHVQEKHQSPILSRILTDFAKIKA